MPPSDDHPDDHHIPASRCLDALRDAGCDHVVTVPDWVQIAMHQRLEAGEPGLPVIGCCAEDQAVTVAAGLTIGGRRPVVVVQNQGLYACVNTIRAVALDARVPLVFMVGQFGRETANFGRDPALSRRRMVSLLEPLLGAMGVASWRLETAADLAHVATAFAHAHAQRTAAVLVVGAPMAWS
jgi:sulfopyruvate decarboxylase TPP-binding subunit